MRKEKISQYALNGSLHTLSITTQEPVKEPTTAAVADAITLKFKDPNQQQSVIRVNPNDHHGDLFRFSDLCWVMQNIAADIGISEYRFQRTDFRLDNYESEHYHAFAKLNRYLISALAVANGLRNNYITHGLFTNRQLSVAVRSTRIAAENYDRTAKSALTQNRTEPAKARFELRSMEKTWQEIYAAETGDNMELLKQEYLSAWNRRIDVMTSLENLELTQQTYNNELEKLYWDLKAEPTTQIRSVTEFVMRYQNCIYSKKQLIDLYCRLGKPGVNHKEQATNYKKRYKIEFFSHADVLKAAQEIKRAMQQFFNN